MGEDKEALAGQVEGDAVGYLGVQFVPIF